MSYYVMLYYVMVIMVITGGPIVRLKIGGHYISPSSDSFEKPWSLFPSTNPRRSHNWKEAEKSILLCQDLLMTKLLKMVLLVALRYCSI